MDQIKVTYRDRPSETYDVTNADRVKFDLQRAKSKWPPATEAPFLAQTYMAWTAARRHGYRGSWSDFSEDEAVDVEFLTDSEGDGLDP